MTGRAALRRASKLAVAALALSAGLLLPALAVAQAYPSRAVKIIVPFPAGGPLDSTARLLADKLAGSTKQPFVVENRPGGAGNLGTDAVAKAAAEGYTLLLVPDTPLTVNPWLYPKLAIHFRRYGADAQSRQALRGLRCPDSRSLFAADVSKRIAQVAALPAKIPHLVARACRARHARKASPPGALSSRERRWRHDAGGSGNSSIGRGPTSL